MEHCFRGKASLCEDVWRGNGGCLWVRVKMGGGGGGGGYASCSSMGTI